MNDIIKLYSEDIAALVKEAIKSTNMANVQGDGTFEVLATTEAVDRDGDVIKADGWDLAPYLKNPVVLWAHNYSLPPIGAITDIKQTANGMIVKGVFAKTEMGQQIRGLYDDGIVRAMSVGFIPKERTGNIITKQELLEISFVPVPANSEAVSLRRIADVQEAVTKMLDGNTKTADLKESKGVVEDVAAAMEQTTWDDIDAKLDELDEVYAIVGALREVYLRPETPVDAFKGLLVEAIVLLQAEVDETDTDGQNEMVKMAKDFRGRFKAGRVLSAANKEKLQKAMEHMTASQEHLKDVISSATDEADGGDEDKAFGNGDDRLGTDDMVLSAVRAVDKACEHAVRLAKIRAAISR